MGCSFFVGQSTLPVSKLMHNPPDSTLPRDEQPSEDLRANRHGAFKPTSYLEHYEHFFRDLRHREIRLLELGIYKGASLLMWRDYFSHGLIAGLDFDEASIDDPSGRISTYRGLQQDCDLLDRIAREVAPDGFDIIIDDASHIAEYTQISFWHLFEKHLKSGGIYIIEDWGTGYWPDWPDGEKCDLARQRTPARSFFKKPRLRTHQYGMVGFIKQLVDECGAGDVTDIQRGVPPVRPSTISRMQISQGQVFVFKR
jgi:hypothetical protein